MYKSDTHNDTSVKYIFLVKGKIVCHFSKNHRSSLYTHKQFCQVLTMVCDLKFVGIFHGTLHWSMSGL